MRSDVVKKGVPAAPNRSLLYALGYTKEELERPLIGVVSYRISTDTVTDAHLKRECGILLHKVERNIQTSYLCITSRQNTAAKATCGWEAITRSISSISMRKPRILI